MRPLLNARDHVQESCQLAPPDQPSMRPLLNARDHVDSNANKRHKVNLQ